MWAWKRMASWFVESGCAVWRRSDICRSQRYWQDSWVSSGGGHTMKEVAKHNKKGVVWVVLSKNFASMSSVFNKWFFSEVLNSRSTDEFSERLHIVLFTSWMPSTTAPQTYWILRGGTAVPPDCPLHTQGSWVECRLQRHHRRKTRAAWAWGDGQSPWMRRLLAIPSRSVNTATDTVMREWCGTFTTSRSRWRKLSRTKRPCACFRRFATIFRWWNFILCVCSELTRRRSLVQAPLSVPECEGRGGSCASPRTLSRGNCVVPSTWGCVRLQIHAGRELPKGDDPRTDHGWGFTRISRAGNPKRKRPNCQRCRRPDAVGWAPLVGQARWLPPSGDCGSVATCPVQWRTVRKGGDPRTDQATKGADS